MPNFKIVPNEMRPQTVRATTKWAEVIREIAINKKTIVIEEPLGQIMALRLQLDKTYPNLMMRQRKTADENESYIIWTEVRT